VTTITFGTALGNVGQVTISPDGSYALVPNCASNMIQRVQLSSGANSVLAGSATAGRLDGVGTNANFRCPKGVAMHPAGTYALITDTNNNAIRKLDLASFAVTTMVGTCSGTTACTAGRTDGATLLTSTLSSPQGITIHPDGSAAFFTDSGNCLIRRIQLGSAESILAVAGTGSCVNTAPAGIGITAAFGAIPTCRISPDMKSLLITDRDAKRMRLMDLATLSVNTGVSTGSFDLLDGDLVGSQSSFLVLNYAGYVVLSITNPGGVSTTIVGTGGVGTADGTGTSASINWPITLTVWRCGLPGYGTITSDAVC
jgi:DNA-binding beta-propeller fold protein YncE